MKTHYGGDCRQAEGDLLLVLMAHPELGIRVVNRNQVGRNLGKSPAAIARATPDEDRRGWDFWLYVEGKWVRIDLTLSRDSKVLDEKARKERREGILVVGLPGVDFGLALMGCTQDLNKIKAALWGLIEFLNSK
jgi:hypothetical protein